MLEMCEGHRAWKGLSKGKTNLHMKILNFSHRFVGRGSSISRKVT